MSNPFYLIPIPPDGPFCDRERERRELIGHAHARGNVVLASPRRYGKTSLVQRVQAELAAEGAVTVYCDFFGVASVEDTAGRLARAVYAQVHGRQRLWKRAVALLRSFRPVLRPDAQGGVALSVEPAAAGRGGLELLTETMEALATFIEQTEELVHIAVDEFQEIVVLREAPAVEAELRAGMSRIRSPWLFVGSRRRLLLAIFSERQRPFFQSAIHFPLGPLPGPDLRRYLRERFAAGGRDLDEAAAEGLAGLAQGHPYYAQKLGYFAWQQSEPDRAGAIPPDATLAEAALEQLLLAETPVFEATVSTLTPQQRLLLRALSREPTPHLLTTAYMERHRLGSVGGVQKAIAALVDQDLAERQDDGPWHLTDPMLARWLNLKSEERIEGAP